MRDGSNATNEERIANKEGRRKGENVREEERARE